MSTLDVIAGAGGYIAAGLAVLCSVFAGVFLGEVAKRDIRSDLGRAAQFTSATFYLGALAIFLIVVTK